MIEMRRSRIKAKLKDGDQQGGGIGTSGDRDQHTISRSDEHGSLDALDKRLGGVWQKHGGAGWTRTSDNAIMSRALYHLSYGTAQAGARAGRPRRRRSYLAVCARAFSLRFFTRRLASATRFLLFKSSPDTRRIRANAGARVWDQLVADIGCRAAWSDFLPQLYSSSLAGADDAPRSRPLRRLGSSRNQ